MIKYALKESVDSEYLGYWSEFASNKLATALRTRYEPNKGGYLFWLKVRVTLFMRAEQRKTQKEQPVETPEAPVFDESGESPWTESEDPALALDLLNRKFFYLRGEGPPDNIEEYIVEKEFLAKIVIPFLNFLSEFLMETENKYKGKIANRWYEACQLLFILIRCVMDMNTHAETDYFTGLQESYLAATDAESFGNLKAASLDFLVPKKHVDSGSEVTTAILDSANNTAQISDHSVYALLYRGLSKEEASSRRSDTVAKRGQRYTGRISDIFLHWRGQLSLDERERCDELLAPDLILSKQSKQKEDPQISSENRRMFMMLWDEVLKVIHDGD